MDVAEAKIKLRRLEALISNELMGFEKDTGMTVRALDITRSTSINSEPDTLSFVLARVEL